MAQNVSEFIDENKISLSKQLTAFVDTEDAEYARAFKWSAVGTKHVQAVRAKPGQNKVKLYLGREILARKLERDLRPGETVRFVNGNRLDCRRDNLEAWQKRIRK